VGVVARASYPDAMPSEPGAPPFLPAGRQVLLPGRGSTFVRELPGPAGAPTLVLLHGWTATAGLNWFACFEPLSKLFRVIALDHRGHGRGIRSRRPFRLEDCADDVAALAAQLGIDRLIPVGYSMGGPIAQLVWRRHRELVAGLVLCATARRFASGRPAERAFFSGVVGLSVAATMSPDGLRRRALGLVLRTRFNGTELSDWATGECERNDPVALLQAGAALGRFDSREWLGGIDVPTAVVVTEDDSVVSPKSQLALARDIPRAQVFGVRADHGVCSLAPERFVPVLSAACRHVARTLSPAERDA
jgi:3-oxoadipate enol-lactonase